MEGFLPPLMTRDEEIEMLKRQKEALEWELEKVKERLSSLEPAE